MDLDLGDPTLPDTRHVAVPHSAATVQRGRAETFVGPARQAAPHGQAEARPLQDALLVLDIETVVDETLIPPSWPSDRFPKTAWHRVVAISFVEADIVHDADMGLEAYCITGCRSGGEEGWDEARLLRGFWRHFGSRSFRCVTWNGRQFDLPTILQRSMLHGIPAAAWFRRGTRWAGYETRYVGDWHTDLMDVMAVHGAAPRLTLEEAAALIGLPGKMGEHGTHVAGLIAGGELGRVRNYCETDTLNTALLYIRHQHLSGRIAAEAHDQAVRDMMGYLELERARRPHLGAYLDAWRTLSGTRSIFVAERDERFR